MAGAPSRCCHGRFKLRVAPYSPQSQTASGTTTANARYSRSSTIRRPIGLTVVVSLSEARNGATAPRISDTVATWAVHCGYAAAAATRAVLTVAIPQTMSGTDLARSRCARARNSRMPPATVANRRPGNRGSPVRNGPSAAPIAPNAAEAEKAAIKLVSQAWARSAPAFRGCRLEIATSAPASAVGVDSLASVSDSGADPSTNANDMAVNAAPIACSGIAVIAATMAAVEPVTANATIAVNATALLDITRMAVAQVAAAAAANSAFGAA